MATFEEVVESPQNWGGNGGRLTQPTPENPNGYTGGWVQGAHGTGWLPTDKAAFLAAQKWQPTGRALDVDRYRGLGEAAAGRGAPSLDYGDANRHLNGGVTALNQAYGDRNLAYEARGEQLGALALQRSAAMGEQPSQAQLLGRSMIDQSLNAQLAGAASARGGTLAQAAAQRQAMQGAAQFRAQGAQQLSAMRADEMDRARGAYMQGASGIRGMDYAGADQATRIAGARTDMGRTAAQMAQAQGQLVMSQRALNDQTRQGYETMGFNTNQAALNAGLARAGAAQQADQFGQQMQLGQQEATNNLIGAGIGGGATLGAGMMRAEGGPVSAGKPYIVGERGPELVVPAENGTVVPADKTRQASLAAAAATRTKLGGAPAARKPMTPEELRRAADKLEAEMRGDHAARMAQGPAVGTVQPRTINAAPVVFGPEDEPVAAPPPSMGQAVALMGGRADPYPYDAPQLMGGREDPYR